MNVMNPIFTETKLDRWLWRIAAVLGIVGFVYLIGWMQESDARAMKTSYTSPITSKKGVIGIGLPLQFAAQSRNPAQGLRLFCLCPIFGGSDGRAQALPVSLRELPGRPTHSSCRPRLVSRAAVLQPQLWRSHMTQPTLASFIALPESSHNSILQAREALETLALLCLEVANKSMGHPSKDGYLGLPAEGLSSLLLCIHNGIDTVGAELVPSLLKRYPTTEGEAA